MGLQQRMFGGYEFKGKRSKFELFQSGTGRTRDIQNLKVQITAEFSISDESDEQLLATHLAKAFESYEQKQENLGL